MRVHRLGRCAPRPCVCLLGTFDGLHLGHQALIEEGRVLARRLNVALSVVLFEPQPQEFFSNEPPVRLTTFVEKCQLLAAYGVEQVWVMAFTAATARLTPEAFLDKLQAQGACGLVCGTDFRFGHQRQGDVAWLQAHAPLRGLSLVVVASVTDAEARMSSSRCRQWLQAKQWSRLREALGRHYAWSLRLRAMGPGLWQAHRAGPWPTDPLPVCLAGEAGILHQGVLQLPASLAVAQTRVWLVLGEGLTDAG